MDNPANRGLSWINQPICLRARRIKNVNFCQLPALSFFSAEKSADRPTRPRVTLANLSKSSGQIGLIFRISRYPLAVSFSQF